MFIKGRVWHVALLLVAGTLAMGSSCSTSSNGVGPAPPPPAVTACASDPLGDSNSVPPNGTSYDITNLCVTRSTPAGGTETTVSVSITLAQPPVLGAAGSGPSITNFDAQIRVDIDGDTDSEAAVDVSASGRLADGNYPLITQFGGMGEATPFVNGDTVTFVFGLAAVPAGGTLGILAIVGIDLHPTDVAPKGGLLTVGARRAPLTVGPRMSIPTMWALPDWAKRS